MVQDWLCTGRVWYRTGYVQDGYVRVVYMPDYIPGMYTYHPGPPFYKVIMHINEV